MSQSAANAPARQEARDTVVYEQPLTERMRTFLRIEFLARQAQHHARQPSAWSSRAAMGSLIEILAIVSRGDVRGEVLKDLERHATMLSGFASRPGVDRTRLDALLERISQLRQQLSSCGANYTQPLKDSEFLASIRHRSAIPGGTCEFDLPAYYAWQQHPPERRRADLLRWMETLNPLAAALHVLLGLLRDTGVPHRVVAPGGQFQQSLPQGKVYQLLRVRLDDAELIPEISGHRLMVSVRLMKTEPDGRLRPAGSDASFELTLCA